MPAHPDFTSPLRWEVRLADAITVARESHRSVLVVHGSATCAGTRLMVERTMAKEEIVEFVDAWLVPLASRAESTEPEVEALLATLPRRAPTPVLLYLAVDDDGTRLVHSTVNGRAPAVLLNDMLDGTTRAAQGQRHSSG
jgi:hypothetical protein